MSQSQSKTDHPFLAMPGLTEPMKRFLRELLVGDLVPVSTLRRLIELYRFVIRQAAKRNQHGVNLAMGEAIIQALDTFLAGTSDRMSSGNRLVLQATVRYFVLENTETGGNLTHEDGFFDDARVVNAMLRWFGRDDLAIPLPTPAASRRRASLPVTVIR